MYETKVCRARTRLGCVAREVKRFVDKHPPQRYSTLKRVKCTTCGRYVDVGGKLIEHIFKRHRLVCVCNEIYHEKDVLPFIGHLWHCCVYQTGKDFKRQRDEARYESTLPPDVVKLLKRLEQKYGYVYDQFCDRSPAIDTVDLVLQIIARLMRGET